MILACPHCDTQLSLEPHQAGQESVCPNCQGRFQVPLPQAAVGGNNVAYKSTEMIQFADKKIAAGVCGILVGGLGVHKFILGLNSAGAIMLAVYAACLVGSCLVVPIFGAIAMQVIGLVEGIIYLTKSDEEFFQTYAVEQKQWF